jgi:16S rRNA (cytidine1402-2'-O)-methyltransferase
LVKTLEQISQFFGEDREVSVSRELTKFFEENRRGTAADLSKWYKEHEPKGEIVIVIDGLGRHKYEIEE